MAFLYKLFIGFLVFLQIVFLLALLFGIFILVVQDNSIGGPVIALFPWFGSAQARTIACVACGLGSFGILFGLPLVLMFCWLPDSSHRDYNYDNQSSDNNGWKSGRACCLYCRHYFASPDSPGQCMLYHRTRLPGDDACNNYE